MGSQTLDILRQGIWASLTGGWYYDPYKNILCNTFHLYIWLLLFCFPLVIYFYINIVSIYIWTGYVLVVSTIIGVIKIMNLKLHQLFDTTECILEDNTSGGALSATSGMTNNSRFLQALNSNDTNNNSAGRSVNEIPEVIELEDLKSPEDAGEGDESLQYSESSKTAVPGGTSANYKVDVHRKNSTSNDEASGEEFKGTLSENHQHHSETSIRKENGGKDEEDGMEKVSPGTSEEFEACSGVTGVKGKGRHKTGGVDTDRALRKKGEQRSNSIDVFFSNQQKREEAEEYLKTIPSNSTTSSAFELSNRPERTLTGQGKGLVFWNNNANQWRNHVENPDPGVQPSTSSSGNIHKKDLPRDFSSFHSSASGSGVNKHNKRLNKTSGGSEIVVYPIVEKNEATTGGRFHVHRVDNEFDNEDNEEEEEEEDESKSPLLRKKSAITSISMCSVDRTHSFGQTTAQPLTKQDSMNSNSDKSKYSYESISEKHNKSDKHSASYDIGSFDSIDSETKSGVRQVKETSPSMIIQTSEVGSLPNIDVTSVGSLSMGGGNKSRKSSSPSLTSADRKSLTDRKDGEAGVEYVNERAKRSSSNLSGEPGIEYVNERAKRSLSNLSKLSLKSSPSVHNSSEQFPGEESTEVKQRPSTSRRQSSDSTREKHLSSSVDFELDWLFEHTDSENEKVKQKVEHEVKEENLNYNGSKKEKSPSQEVTGSVGETSEVKCRGRDGDDDDEEEEIVVKKKKRNRRDRRHYCRRSIHAPHPSTSGGASGSVVKKSNDTTLTPKPSGSKKLDTYNLHESFYKNQQQSEDDYDDDADDDVYLSKPRVSTESGNPSNIVYKDLLQIFLATRNPKTDDELFSFRQQQEQEDEGLAAGGAAMSCISTSPVALGGIDSFNKIDMSKIDRHRSGRHSRTSTRNHRRSKHLSRNHRRSPLIRGNSMTPASQQSSPGSSFQVAVSSGTHLAVSHNDTTEGAVHIFRDENGELMSYMFDEKGLGLAQNIRTDTRSKMLKVLMDQQPTAEAPQPPVDQNQPLPSSASTSGENVSSRLLPTVPVNSSAAYVPITQLTQNVNGSFVVESLLPHSRLHRHMNLNMNNINPNTLRVIFSESSPSNLLENDLELVNVIQNGFHLMDSLETPVQQQQEPKRYYQFRIFPCFTNVKIHFNRLMLLSLLDHNFTMFYTLLCLFLTILVALFGSWLLYLNFYKDIHVFIFCFVIAGCQYSMLKSVQPDASSPTHGFNKIIIFSRPVYFIVVSGLVLLFHYSTLYKQTWGSFTVYSIECNPKEVISTAKECLITFLLYFPLVFSFGLFPQVNTCFMYFLEQIDIYIFGGNATCSVVSAMYCVFRSILSVFLLFGFAYAGLSEQKKSQHILFSIYCGLIVATSYHLSRCSSDPMPIWNIVKKYLCPMDDEHLEAKLQGKKLKAEASRKNIRKERKTSSISRYDESFREEKSPSESINRIDQELHDPLPQKLIHTVNARLKSDLIICTLVCIFVFGIHCSTVFSALQPQLNPILWAITISLGLLLHYIFPHLRKQLPWLCVSRPVLKANEYSQFEVRGQAKIMWFEKLHVYFCFFERNIVYPVLFIASITYDAPLIVDKFGLLGGSLILTVCALKALRSSFSDPSYQYLILCFSVLLFQYDFGNKVSETFLLDYCLTSIVFCKSYEFLLKIQFVITYIAPWQITWGSAFHAFAQPFSVPHSAMMFLQACISAIMSSPLYPFLGSAIFLTSYPRPVKFWERDYNTRRADHSNTRLVTQFDRTIGSDDNNLNSIFYEHLTRSLQHSLCGDLALGRWGSVSQGDCFVLASDYLNCLIHIVEVGNGLVTFQMRGLEFRGTYCQQREVEAISQNVEDNEGCCCCEPGHLPHLLSLNAAFSQRWLAWEVTTTKYVLEGYSISDIPAASMLQVFDFRKVLISYYVRSIIYYASKATKLEEWLNHPQILAALRGTLDRSFVDLDPVFNMNIDEDYDFRSSGITRNSYCSNYLDWIHYCVGRRKNLTIDKAKDSPFVSLCFALSLLGRRTLGAASHNTVSSVEFFLYGLHALFKGDFRITCERDEWVFIDMDLLKKVVAPAVKMSLKLHQDHFTSPDDYDDAPTLYNAISQHNDKLVISHEGDPTWRNAVLSGTQSLLALRHVLDDGVDEYKVIMLNKRYLSFRIIKMNRECVRGLWAGQQQELVYLRNKNPERGSIQNAKQALRNIINSSCDQPIGYPIFVSPLTTSYAETNEQLSSIVGGSLSLGVVKRAVMRFWRRIQRRCIEGCSSGGTVGHEEGGFGHDGVFAMTTFNIHAPYPPSMESNIMSGAGSMSRGNRSSLASIGKPSSSTLASLAGLLSSNSNPSESSTKHMNPSTNTIVSSNCDNISTNPSECSRELKTDGVGSAVGQVKSESCGGGVGGSTLERVRIIDPLQVHDALNLGRRIDVMWPDEKMRARGGKTFWKDWLPEIGMEGQVVHKWVPNHRDLNRRSNVDRTIFLIKIEDKYVPISESGVMQVGSGGGDAGVEDRSEGK
uniref:Pecanex-like protein n=1 Tax=Cacopsylla melanoneura TaxID=428564 RepID=A0A8D8UDQ6_9HEMI